MKIPNLGKIESIRYCNNTEITINATMYRISLINESTKPR